MSQSALSICTHSAVDLTYSLDEPASPTYSVTAQEEQYKQRPREIQDYIRFSTELEQMQLAFNTKYTYLLAKMDLVLLKINQKFFIKKIYLFAFTSYSNIQISIF
jgi:hypothetical protein